RARSRSSSCGRWRRRRVMAGRRKRLARYKCRHHVVFCGPSAGRSGNQAARDDRRRLTKQIDALTSSSTLNILILMRTTLTIDDDLAGLLKQRSQELGVSFRDIVNRTLRAGLGQQAKSHEGPRTIPHSFGFKPGIDLDKLNQLADELEAETYAEGQRTGRKLRQASRHDSARRQRPRPRT